MPVLCPPPRAPASQSKRIEGFAENELADPVMHLSGFAGVDPPAEHGDTLLGPRSVAWHRAGLEPLEDGIGVGRDVVDGPEVEGPTHRVAVALAKQWLDVLLEMQRLLRTRHMS